MLKGFGQMAYEVIFLWLMRGGPVYGYELGSRFERMSDGHIKLSWGTVYPILRRMEKKGLIHSKKDMPTGRVYYELTPKGKAAAESISSRLGEAKGDFDEKFLGFLAVYSALFGREALNELIGGSKH